MYRPITERMLLKMKECRDMEESDPNHILCPPAHFGYSLSGLYKRGLVAVKNYVDENGKTLMGVYLTQKGLNLLKDKAEKLRSLEESN